MAKEHVPYDELDLNIISLVRILNSFDGIATIGSCGGHEGAAPGECPEGTWYVSFEVAHNEDGWHGLEFLAWLVNNDYQKAGHEVTIEPFSGPPYLCFPGRTLRFVMQGFDYEDPDELAQWVAEAKGKYYITPEEAQAYSYDEGEGDQCEQRQPSP